MSNLISKPEFTDKDTSILNEVAFAKGLYGLKDKDGNLDTTFIKNQRGKNLAEIFYTKDGWVNTEVVEYGSDLYYNLLSDSKYYKESLQKYTLVETTSTIAAKPGGYTDNSLLYQGEQTYHGFAVTDGIATGFVNRGTDGAIDLTQDAQMALYQSNPPYVQQSVEFMQNVYDQQKTDKRGVDLGAAKDNVFTTGFSLGKPGSDAQALYVLESGKNLMGNVSFEGYGTTEVLQRANPEAFATFESVLKSVTINYVRANDAVPENFTSTQFGHVVPITSGYGIADGFTDLFNGVNLHGIKNYRFSAYDAEGNIIPDQLNTVMTQKYLSTLDTQANTINQQLQNLSTTDYAIEYSEYLADKANPLYFNKDNLFNELNQIETKKGFFEKVFGGYNNYNGVDNIRYSVDNIVIDVFGGDPANQNILQVLSKSISEQPNAEAKSQFIESLKSSDLIDNLFGVEGSSTVVSSADLIQDLVSKTLDSTRGNVIDPLVLDLDGDGIETTSVDQKILFDHNADNVKRATGWSGADDGLLVRDLDNSNTIDSGRELFGDNTLKADGTKAKDGFDALSDLDSNNDGVFNEQDSAFSEVKVWKDSDQDGVTDEGELLTLAEAGVESINLTGQATAIATDGGVISKTGSYTRTDATTASIGNLDFNQNAIYREFTDKLDTSSFDGMLNVQGIGAVRDLQQAAALSPALADILVQIKDADNYKAKTSFTDNLLQEWVKTSGHISKVDSLDGLTLSDNTRVYYNEPLYEVRDVMNKTRVVEALSTQEIFNYEITDKGSYHQLSISVGHSKTNFFGASSVYGISKGGSLSLSGGSFPYTTDHLRYIYEAYDGLVSSVNESIFIQSEYPKIVENLQFEFNAETSEIEVNFDGVNEYIHEQMIDSLDLGLDIYKSLEKYMGTTFENYGYDFDLESFIRDIPSDILEQINLNNDAKIEISSNVTVSGSSDNDVILGGSENNNIDGGSGNDYILGGDGDDTIHGGKGHDIIDGGAGDDILTGGDSWGGDDTLLGGSGSDTISTSQRSWNSIVEGGLDNDTLILSHGSIDTVRYNLGDGFDTVKKTHGNWNERNDSDRVLFGEGISQEDISFYKQNNDLLIFVKDDSTQGMKIEDFYNSDINSRSQIGSFEFSDGTIINASDLNLDIVGTSEDDVLSGSDLGEFLIGNEGNDTLRAGKGNDTLQGGQGNDKLYGDDNNDTLEGGFGDDYLDGGSHNDVLIGGEGNDTLQGGYGSDKLYGGAGDDTIHTGSWLDRTSNYVEGGQGNDTIISNWGARNNTYKYNLGDGFDVIKNQGIHFDHNYRDHRVLFGEGISQEDVDFQKQGNHLVIIVNGDESQGMRLDNFYLNEARYRSPVNRFEFNDGSIVNASDLNFDIVGTSENDVLSGSDWSESLIGNEGNDTLKAGKGNDTLQGGQGNDKLYGEDNNDTLEGGAGDDYLDGGSHNDVLIGGEGNDTLQGGSGNDKLYGGAGDDTIHTGNWLNQESNYVEGGKGNDTIISNWGASGNIYKYNLGDDFDVIKRQNTSSVYAHRNHKVLFGEGISFEDLSFAKQGNHLVVTIGGDDSQGIRIENFYHSSSSYYSPVNRFEFADGSVLDMSDITIGTDQSDTLTGNDNSNFIYGVDGDDIISGNEGSDIITGGAGNDSISISGTENIIKYNLGDGFDSISSLGEGYEGSDKIVFGEGITQEDLSYNQDGNDLVINVKGDETQGFRLVNFGVEQGSNIGSFEFADGTLASPRDILDQMNKPEPTHIGTDLSEKIIGTNDAVDVVHAGAGDDTVYLGSGDDIADAGDGNDIVKALNGGNNTIDGGSGNDRIETWAGADRLSGGLGDDIIKAGAGDDVITGGLGNDDISGELGNNVINYNLGDGLDTIRAAKLDVTDQTDKIVFGENISQDDVQYLQRNEDLFVQVGADPEQGLLVKKFYEKSGYQTKVSGFEFTDGSFKAIEDIQPVTLGTDSSDKIVGTNDIVDVVHAGAGDDTVYLGSGDDIADAGAGNDIVKALNGGDNTIDGGSGNDRIETGAGSDKLSGGLGNDIIKAGAGDDVITGGQGDDVLAGGAGSDTYNYSTGDGSDTINLAGDGSTDTLKLDDISKEDILFSRSDDDLLIDFSDQLSSLRIDDYFESQFNNDALIIDTNDEFQMLLAANSNKMAEIIAANTSDDDIDGGSVDGSNQTTTQVDASQLADLWVPKNNNNI
ncbi:calcium-binding protein [Francisella sp. 19X1-34]|uniref:calcium-binding protein n=1 Tax=Francisella sp. 19X1-34 TaxID=3087177 RepID=UPI002E342C79|nr:calcium-binding protein [Francisella sp. 19X1-34]MED7788161.1 calcium-binding protein [Francisella sp. 19X1-34]